MAEKKKANKWNLAELQDSLVKDTEQKIEQGFKEIAEQSSEAAVAQQQTQQQALEPVRDITAPAGHVRPGTGLSFSAGFRECWKPPGQTCRRGYWPGRWKCLPALG